MGLGGVNPTGHRHYVLIHHSQKLNVRLVATANVTPKTTNSNSLLPNTASNDIQQHVNSCNVDIRNRTITLIGQLCFRGHGIRCQGVQSNEK